MLHFDVTFEVPCTTIEPKIFLGYVKLTAEINIHSIG